MQKSYDLNLPDWGPYNKDYLGAAHIADGEKGLRFDLNLFPGYYRRSVMSPTAMADCGAKMMAASRDVSHYVYRYELEWKDKVYLEADYSSEQNTMTVVCDFVNNTESPESLALNAVMSMHRRTQYHKEIKSWAVESVNGIWVDAVDYVDIQASQSVANDGLYCCEACESGFVGGSFISRKFFGKAGDLLQYRFAPTFAGKIGVRYRGEGSLNIRTDTETYEVVLPFCEDPQVYYFEIKPESVSSLAVSPKDCEADFDGFVIGDDLQVCDEEHLLIPQYEMVPGGIQMAFGDMRYTAEFDCDDFVVRHLKTDNIGQILGTNIHDHFRKELGTSGHDCIDLFIRPVFVGPKSSKRITIKITAQKESDFHGDHRLYAPQCNPDGEKYRVSQTIMSAVTLTNVVWPVYSRRGYIRHNTPGRIWDSLYTWDSGFIGMGLSEMDIDRAKDCLNAYLTPVGDRHSPYIFHGTPLPTQIFLYAEIFGKTGDVNFLKDFYPMIRQQYRFFADKRKTGQISPSGLFSLWKIFYNSGGWDDYPTQEYVHQNHLTDEVCPVINTAMTVLCAKILKNHAEIAGFDTKEYDEDIEFYSNAINRYAWDEASGYYGYVKKDGSILKIDGVNGDMGMDGAFPFVAGISDGERTARILDNIKGGMLTEIGVSVVDTRAPYYKHDGYWNGSIWMPHQWILWKACLDHGEADLANRIAETALGLWEREVAHTYNCYEHFMIENGRGAGFHQFSGLSTPVLMWFSALYKPYTVTSGFMTVITEKITRENGMEFSVRSTAKKPIVLLCLPQDEEFVIKTTGKVHAKGGIYTIAFDGPVSETVTVERKQ